MRNRSIMSPRTCGSPCDVHGVSHGIVQSAHLLQVAGNLRCPEGSGWVKGGKYSGDDTLRSF